MIADKLIDALLTEGVVHRAKAPDGTEYRVKKVDGEWQSRAYVNGKHHEPWTSYHDSKEDAIGTANAQAKSDFHHVKDQLYKKGFDRHMAEHKCDPFCDAPSGRKWADQKAEAGYQRAKTVLGAGMSPAARKADIEQSDREYIRKEQFRRLKKHRISGRPGSYSNT